MDSGNLELALLVGAVVLLVAVGAVRLSTRIGVPGLLLYLAIGMALGENGIGLEFDDAAQARDIGLVALALILAEGGLTTRWREIKPAVPRAVALATVGVLVSASVTAAFAYLALGTDWRLSAIIGAVVSSTDAAAVFATLRNLRLPRRLSGLLEAESGFNDAPAVILVTVLAEEHGGGVLAVAGEMLFELVVGAGIGIGVGAVAVVALRRTVLPAAGLYPISALAFAILAYAAASTAHASGFLAVYLTGLWMAANRLPHQRATVGFAEGVGWLAQIGLFVMLGLLSTPARLDDAILPALLVGAGLLLLARPLSVVLSLVWFRVPWREMAFLSWAGLRGAVPIVLTTIPLSTGLAGSEKVFDTVFVLVIVYTLIQTPLLAPLARRLGLDLPTQPRELSVESAPLDEVYADLLDVGITDRSRMHNMEVWELRLPAGAAVTMVVREGRPFVPESDTVLRRGDRILVVTTRAQRGATEQRLQAVSQGGRLARFLGATTPEEH